MKTEIAGDRGGKWGVFLICLDVSQYKGGAFKTQFRAIARRNKFKSYGGISAALWIFVCFSLSEKIL